MELADLFKGFQEFVGNIYLELSKLGIDVLDLTFDHFGYQTSSSDDYELIKNKLLNDGQLVSENIVGGRRVGIFKLNSPLFYKEKSVDVVELVEPKIDQVCESKLDHVEFVINNSFDWYLDKYPKVNWDLSAKDRKEFSKLQLRLDGGEGVKFHMANILDEIPRK